MCRQDGHAAIWHVLHETVGWPAEAGGSSLPRLGQETLEELPTWAAELEIQVVAIQAGEAAEDTEPPSRSRGSGSTQRDADRPVECGGAGEQDS
jgi:hypothetical protein